MSGPTTFLYSIRLNCNTFRDDDSVMNMSYDGTVDVQGFKDAFITAISDLIMIHINDEYERPTGNPTSLSKPDITTFFAPSIEFSEDEQEKLDEVISHVFTMMKLAYREADALSTRAEPNSVNFELTADSFMIRVTLGEQAEN